MRRPARRGLVEPLTDQGSAELQQRPAGSGFEPLCGRACAWFERLGRSKRRPVQFAAETRAALNESLAQLCGPDGGRLVREHRKAAAKIRASVARDAGSLLTTLRKLEAATEPGA